MLKKLFKMMLVITLVLTITLIISCGSSNKEVVTNNNTYTITYILDGEIKNLEPSTYQTTDKIYLPTFIDDDFSGWYTTSDCTGAMVISFTNQIGDKVFFGKTTDNSTDSDKKTDDKKTEDEEENTPVIENPTDNKELAEIIKNIDKYQYTFDYNESESDDYDYTDNYAYDYDDDYEYYECSYDYDGETYKYYYIFDLNSADYAVVDLNEDETAYEKYESTEYDLSYYLMYFDVINPEDIDASKFVKDGNVYHLITSELTSACNDFLCLDEDDETTYKSFDLYVENNHITKIIIKAKVESESYGNYSPIYTITFTYNDTKVTIPTTE